MSSNKYIEKAAVQRIAHFWISISNRYTISMMHIEYCKRGILPFGGISFIHGCGWLWQRKTDDRMCWQQWQCWQGGGKPVKKCHKHQTKDKNKDKDKDKDRDRQRRRQKQMMGCICNACKG